MEPSAKPLRVAGLGDLHVGPGSPSYRDLFAEISARADVLALCGDLTNLGTEREARALAEDLRACKIPILAVLGNHDHECGNPAGVEHVLGEAGVQFLEHEPVIVGGVGFAGVKGFGGGFGARMLGSFGEAGIKQFVREAVDEAMRLEAALGSLTTARKVVVLHYAPVADTVENEPREIYQFLGSSRLAEVIDHSGGVAAVLHGHAHLGPFRGRTPGGVPVFNCAQPVEKDEGRPYALIEV